jgi:hypothetical protein
MVGVKVRFKTQPLPVLKDAQPNVAGADQPAGKTAPPAFEMPNPLMVRPSLEVNVTLTVLVVPTSTDTTLLGGVATTLSWVPLTLPGSLVKPPGVEAVPPTPAAVLLAGVVLPNSEL